MSGYAIETLHPIKGYRFRSRLEARWAVFFETLGVDYLYEPEGFCFDGISYLPDFYLPLVDCYLEVKPSTPNAEEQNKAGLLMQNILRPVVFLVGEIGKHRSFDVHSTAVDDYLRDTVLTLTCAELLPEFERIGRQEKGEEAINSVPHNGWINGCKSVRMAPFGIVLATYRLDWGKVLYGNNFRLWLHKAWLEARQRNGLADLCSPFQLSEQHIPFFSNVDKGAYKKAVLAANGARFEFGETPFRGHCHDAP